MLREEKSTLIGPLSLEGIGAEQQTSKGAQTTIPAGSGGDPDGSTTAATDEASEETEELPLDAVFEILKNERRRRTLWYLKEHEQPVTLSDLAEHIAALENDTTVAKLNSKERKRAYVGLYQCHLPKMDELGAIDFNRSRGLIAMGNCSEQLFEYLDTEEEDTNWAGYYLGVAAVSGALLGTGTLLLGTASTMITILSGISILSFALLAGVQGAHQLPDEEDDDQSNSLEKAVAVITDRLPA